MSSALAEHYSYLKLPGRHKAYGSAIARVVSGGETVADLGCGFGVLGIQCLRQGASHVWGIDHSDALEIARETLARQGLADRYTCIRDSTFRASLPQQVDVIICDHVGFFGIDYGIIEMLGDARARMLKPGGTVMPRRIGLRIAGVTSAQCSDLVENWTRPPVPSEFGWLQEHSVNSLHAVTLTPEELCTAAVELGEVRIDQDSPESLSFTATITAAKDCTLHGLAGWFDCELAEDVWMTNSPIAEESIGRPQAFFPLESPIRARTGDSFDVTFRIRHGEAIFAWTLSPQSGDPVQRMTSWKSRILTQKDLQTRLDEPLRLNDRGSARVKILSLVDGQRTAREIEAMVLKLYPDLFASAAEISRFLRAELGEGTDS